MFVPLKRGSVHPTSPGSPPTRSMPYLNLSRVLRSRLQLLHCHHAIVVTPRRAPHRSLRPSGDFPTVDASLGAPSHACADPTHPRRVKIIACIITCPSPSSLERSTRASIPSSLAYEPCAALPLEGSLALGMVPPDDSPEGSPPDIPIVAHPPDIQPKPDTKHPVDIAARCTDALSPEG